MRLRALSRPDRLIGGATSLTEDLCDRVFLLLMAESMRIAGWGREVGALGSSSFFDKIPLILPRPRENISMLTLVTQPASVGDKLHQNLQAASPSLLMSLLGQNPAAP